MNSLDSKDQAESLKSLLDDLSESEFTELTEYLFSGDGGRQLLFQLLWPHMHSKRNQNSLLTMELLTGIVSEIKEDREMEDENLNDDDADSNEEDSEDELTTAPSSDVESECKETITERSSLQSLSTEMTDSKQSTKKKKKRCFKSAALLFSKHPFIKYGTSRDQRPFMWIYIHRIDQQSSGGYVKRKYLVDSGAKRSSLYQGDAEALKLSRKGRVTVVTATEKRDRHLVRVRISTGKGKGGGKWETESSAVQITCNVRTSKSNIKRGILGADWLSAVRPRWPSS